jgi:hypothetical protein
MGLDIRLPIGLMFSILGVLLSGYGLITKANTEMYQRSLNLNINLYWGLFLLVFGGIMLGAALKDRYAKK